MCYTIFMFKTFVAVLSHFTFFFSTSIRPVLGPFVIDTWTLVVLKNSEPPLWLHRVRTFVYIQGHFFLGVFFLIF